jgi:hypothetical protein
MNALPLADSREMDGDDAAHEQARQAYLRQVKDLGKLQQRFSPCDIVDLLGHADDGSDRLECSGCSSDGPSL